MVRIHVGQPIISLRRSATRTKPRRGKAAQTFSHHVDGLRAVEKMSVFELGHWRRFRLHRISARQVGGSRPQIAHPRFLELEEPRRL